MSGRRAFPTSMKSRSKHACVRVSTNFFPGDRMTRSLVDVTFELKTARRRGGGPSLFLPFTEDINPLSKGSIKFLLFMTRVTDSFHPHLAAKEPGNFFFKPAGPMQGREMCLGTGAGLASQQYWPQWFGMVRKIPVELHHAVCHPSHRR